MRKKGAQRVGILGAGQLALMLAQAGEKIGVDVVCAGQKGDCAEQVARLAPRDLKDRAAVEAFAREVDVLTIESENIEIEVLKGLNVFPAPQAIAITQDRLLEKRFFQECGLSVAPFAAVESMADLERAAGHIGFPAILKTRRGGYDGKGQARLVGPQDMAGAWRDVGGRPCILEGMVRFDTEVSLIAARNQQGQIVFYPLTENFHREGILRLSVAPCERAELQAQAEIPMLKLLEKMSYVGVLAIEFFVQGDKLLANEMAPRVHNSGHWTIEGAETSQFENHLRAVLGMELGGALSKPTVMLNCIGSMPPLAETRKFSGLFRHDYGKEARPGRKVGHLTCSAFESETIEEWQARLGLL